MAITFTNTIYDDIMENLATVMNDEFSIPVYYDSHKGNHSFLLTPDSDDFVEQLSTGIHRSFNINVEYELKQGGQYNKNTFKQISNVMERFRRLIYNNNSYENGAKWFDARIESVEYERDEDDPALLRATAVFNCQNIEVI